MARLIFTVLLLGTVPPQATMPTVNQLDERLVMLRPFVGLKCVGVLDEAEVSMHITATLNGKAVRRTTTAAVLGYSDETLMYWDIEEQRLSFLEVTSRGHIARGEVLARPDGVALRGRLVTPQASTEFMNSLALIANGNVRDAWYNLEGGEWRLGHSVECVQRP